MTFRVLFTKKAREMLRSISDRRIRAQIIQRVEKLAEEPEKQGKPLGSELAGYRSIRAVGQRYRIIYRVDRDEVQVLIIAVGIRRDRHRRDVYRLAQRLIQMGLLPPQNGVGQL
ncbi:MAG: type II toxin-antitoxin system RelE/ParE family toxin [Dehalococcoidia bacterium]|nr:type II toxin-antitoxin system RelE/ParE family toxin [Dehalococcoidia bacterium]